MCYDDNDDRDDGDDGDQDDGDVMMSVLPPGGRSVRASRPDLLS